MKRLWLTDHRRPVKLLHDPLIRHRTIENVFSYALNSRHLLLYNRYLKGLDISVNVFAFVHIYILERIIFYYNSNEIEILEKYIDLSNYLITRGGNKSYKFLLMLTYLILVNFRGL